ncbi:MAG: transcription-repair coupling factor [Coxiellaceae bacterium]|nr:transcription-repair coupling factor [Coxiellaceae bacterium]|tara:strand:- start:5045 stop:8485 length:3441 start_codon:yes stop_codon:yes gene_type:complete
MANVLHPDCPQSHQNNHRWGGLVYSAKTLACAQLATQSSGPLCLLTADIHAAEQLRRELPFFLPDQFPVLYFPDRETLPYDMFSPHQDLVSERLRVLATLPQLSRGIVIAALPTVMHVLPPSSHLSAHSLQLAKEQTLLVDQFRQQLVLGGYRHVSQVMEHGEFLVRGSIIDVYPMGSELPVRIELFDDTIDSLRTFDPETQRTVEKITELTLLPAQEYALDDEAIAHFRQAWRATFSGNPLDSPSYEAITDGHHLAGVEMYLPLFFEDTSVFMDYLPQNTRIIQTQPLNAHLDQFLNEVNHRYEQYRYDQTRPLLPPSQLFMSSDVFFSRLNSFSCIRIDDSADHNTHDDFEIVALPTFNSQTKEITAYQDLAVWLKDKKGRMLFTAESAGRREVMQQQLKAVGLSPSLCESWNDFLNSDVEIGLTVANLDHGFFDHQNTITIITESDIHGDYVAQRRKRRSHSTLEQHAIIKHLTELSIGDLVVHLEHGVGRYLGLEKLNTGGLEAEYLVLEYANNDKIFVPVTSLFMISRYNGQDSEHVSLHRLGSTAWEKAKRKAAEKIHDVAAELLALHAKREATPGQAFSIEEHDYQRFRSAFPFEETPDQMNAIDAVREDMTTAKSMDRLVCGDVGFGKTEIAMQAAFIAVMNGQQVSVLVPTTLLAQQHYQTFCDRFADWPISIGVVCRLQTPKQQKITLEQLALGQVDIIIGTHKLLQPTIRFKKLGLIIVDEEHRFGVRQKEKIQAMRAEVDLLTLTATPIPRTLNMALSGTRDLSIIATPPAKRLAIKTFLQRFSSTIIQEAMQRELLRGGQLYFLHNDVASMETMKEQLSTMVPQARIAIAHGQMSEKQLERVMADFYHQKFNVLLSTTIIESGIDVPTANTILINKADRFGLAQLHQIRGRVGRSHHQAYAYLLVDEPTAISKDAQKRFDALLSQDDLGAGFYLATHDLEIRGAGELLGEGQSGHMQAIGFTLYMDMLEEAVEAIKAGKPINSEPRQSQQASVECGIPALLPDTYIHDVNTRLSLYQRINDCQDKERIDDLQSECIDRFGLLPQPAKNLFAIQELRHKATQLGIEKIEIKQTFGYITFKQEHAVDPAHLIHLIQNQPKLYQLHTQSGIRFTCTAKSHDRITTIQSVLTDIHHE